MFRMSVSLAGSASRIGSSTVLADWRQGQQVMLPAVLAKEGEKQKPRRGTDRPAHRPLALPGGQSKY